MDGWRVDGGWVCGGWTEGGWQTDGWTDACMDNLIDLQRKHISSCNVSPLSAICILGGLNRQQLQVPIVENVWLWSGATKTAFCPVWGWMGAFEWWPWEPECSWWMQHHLSIQWVVILRVPLSEAWGLHAFVCLFVPGTVYEPRMKRFICNQHVIFFHILTSRKRKMIHVCNWFSGIFATRCL